MENKKNVFETLSAINVSGKTEKKNGLTYLSWSYAWGEVKKLYSSAQYKVYERDTQYGPVNYFTDGMTCYVKVGVTIEGLEYIEMLPVMDYRNKSIALDKVTSCDVNKTIQRAITKAIARHGLGLYVYAGEDYPDTAPTQSVQTLVKAAPEAPVKDTRPVTSQMVDFIRKTVEEQGVTGDFIDFICESYKVCKLEDLRIYQFNHIKQNIEKLKTMFDAKRKKRLADVVKNANITVDPAAVKPKDIGTTFGDAILAQQPQEKNEGEEVSLESLGLSPEEMEALIECGDVFS